MADPTDLPHPDRAPRRRPAGRRRRVRRPLVVSYRREALPRHPAVADLRRRATTATARRSTFESELTSAGLAATPTGTSPRLRIGATSFVTPVADLRHRPGHRRADAAARAAGARRLPPRGVRASAATGRCAADGARVPMSIIHRAGCRIPGAGAALRLRRLRVVRGSALLDRPVVAAGPRHGVRRRARARRRRARQAVVRARQDAGEEEHLHRLHRGGTASRRHRT